MNSKITTNLLDTQYMEHAGNMRQPMQQLLARAVMSSGSREVETICEVLAILLVSAGVPYSFYRLVSLPAALGQPKPSVPPSSQQREAANQKQVAAAIRKTPFQAPAVTENSIYCSSNTSLLSTLVNQTSSAKPYSSSQQPPCSTPPRSWPVKGPWV